MSCIFRVRVNGEFLVFYPKTVVKFKVKTPFFNYNNEIRSQTFTFKVPVKGNARPLNFAKGYNRRGAIYEFSAEAFLGESFWKNVLVVITNYTETEFSIKIVDAEQDYFNFQDKGLRDFQYLRPSRFRHITSRNNGQYKSYAVVSTTTGVGVISKVVVDTSGGYLGDPDRVVFKVSFAVTDTSDQATVKMIAAINENFWQTGLWAIQDPSISNYFRIYNMSSSVWSEFSFTLDTLETNFVEVTPGGAGAITGGIPTITKTLATDTINQPEGTYDFIYVPVYNPNKDTPTPPATTVQIYDVINDWDSNNNEFYTPYRNRFAPFPFLYNIIEQICEEAKINIDDLFFNDELKKLLIYSPLITAHNNGLVFDTWPYFQYSKILPQLKTSELFTILRGYFGFISDYNSKSKTLKITTLKRELARKDYKDLSAKTRYGQDLQYDKRIQNYEYSFDGEPLSTERIVQNSELYYFVGEKTDKADLPFNARDNNAWHVLNTNTYYYNDGDFGGTYWIYLSEVLQGIFDTNSTDNNKPQGSVPFSIELYHKNDVAEPAVKCLLPYTKADTQLYVNQKNKYPFRLMFYRGMKDGLIDTAESGSPIFEPMQYPFASYHNYDYNKNKIGNYSLAWVGPDGLFNQFHKEIDAVLRNSRPVNFQMDITVNDILNLDVLQQNLRDGNVFVPDEYELTFSEVIEPVKSKEFLRK